MNNLIIASLLLIANLCFPVSEKEQTIVNLQMAFNVETTASAKYAGYAEKAKKDGLSRIATMFSAVSKVKAIYAANFRSVLVKMGQTITPVKPGFDIRTTRENINDAIKGESEGITIIYPGYISTAKLESVNDAIKAFRWTMETEKKRQPVYQSMLNALNANTANLLPNVYWVCPKCGNLYNVSKPEASCSFCSTPSSKFLKFN